MVLATVVSWLFYIVSLQPPGCIVSILTENRKKASEKWKKNRVASEKDIRNEQKTEIGFMLTFVGSRQPFVKIG